MKSIVIKELKIMLREKGNFFFLILMPIMFIVLFASILGNIADGNVIEQIVPGYMVMFVFFIWISMVNRFQTERDSGMVARLRSTPMKPPLYLVGMWLPSAISVLVQCTVLLSFGYFVYDVHLGNVGAVSLIVLCLTLCGTGLGLGLSLIVKSFNQGLAITQVFALGGAMVAGLWFPLDMMPEFVQTIGKFTPQYWAQTGLQDVMVRGAHTGDVWLTLVILLAFAAGGLLIALWRYKHFLRSATN